MHAFIHVCGNMGGLMDDDGCRAQEEVVVRWVALGGHGGVSGGLEGEPNLSLVASLSRRVGVCCCFITMMDGVMYASRAS